jgi:hypothetical protein
MEHRAEYLAAPFVTFWIFCNCDLSPLS